MALYTNVKRHSPLQAVEYAKTPVGNFAFFHIDQPSQVEAIREWATKSLGQEIVAQTVVEGNPVLITRGAKTEAEILEAARAKGGKFHKSQYEKTLDLWKLRGMASVAGQSLQIASAVFNYDKNLSAAEIAARGRWGGVDGPLMTFASLNMVANLMNWVFGSQKSPDTHHLKYLKQQTNNLLVSHVHDGNQLPGVTQNITQERKGPVRETAAQKAGNFLKRNSVVIGELGMRWLASLALVIPMNKKGGKMFSGWADAAKNLAHGDFKTFRKDNVNPKSFFMWVGMGYLLGKVIALFTKVKDPYEPKEHTTMDTFRENVLFKSGSLLEAFCGAMIARNAFTKKHIKINTTVQQDYLGGIGGMIFATGYLIRFAAKFGEKQLDIKEVEAHISDSLAHTKPEEVPQLAADCAAAVKDDLKNHPITPRTTKPMHFGELYAQVVTDLYQHNRAALATLEKKGTLPHVASIRPMVADEVAQANMPTPQVQGEKTVVTAEPKVAVQQGTPPITHAEKAIRREPAELSVSA